MMEGHAEDSQSLTRSDAPSFSSKNNSLWNNSEDDEDLLMIDEDVNMNTSSLRSDERYVGFDNNVGDTWVYPSNFPERAYQYNIVQKALFHNTLVVLPTGLGKTFIAAVVMYNIYRWYPMGKVIFMAPTRPLVTQQIEACCKVMGIPKADSVEITGKLNKATRAQLWQGKRVFFATPQSVQSDIFDRELNFPFDAVKLIVVDEAHRAKGRYAYTDVLRCIWSKNKFFRILALSATPGRRKDDVEEIIRNLFISKLEVRTEDSVDVVSYVHKRQMKTVVVKLGQRLSEIRDELLAIVDPHLRRLIDNHLISARPGNVSRNWLVMEQKKFRESVQNDRVPYQKELNSDFSICISVYHAIELLERHGLRVFLNNFDDTQDGGAKFVVILRPDLRRLIERVREEAGPNPFAFSDQCMVNGEIATIPKNIDFGHPKFEVARDHVLAHFENNKDSRVIIFCEYRESVMLMHRLLLQHRPLIRPRVFVGQGGSGSIRAVTQQQQMKVMNDFRAGESNALIATSVAEEGIDVGEVDLIVCFDINTSNPTRFIQRIGRTGRRKEGKVLLLATEGKEHTILKEVLSERNKLNKSISRGGEFSSIFYKHSPRMVPTVFNPKCIKTFIQPTEEQQPKTKVHNKQKQKNRTVQNDQKRDLRHFFKTKDVLSKEERCIFEQPTKPNSIETQTLTIEDEDDAIVNFSPPIPTSVCSQIVRKYSKFIKSNLKAQIMDARKALTSNRLSKDSLKFLIDLSPDFLDAIWLNLNDIWKKGIDENNVPLKGVSAEDRQAIRSYLQIQNLVGSKEYVAAIVENKRKTVKSSSFSELVGKYDFIFGDLHHNDVSQDNFEYLASKIEKMSKISTSNENSRTSFVQSMVYDGEIDEIVEASSEICDTEHNYSNECMLDSKYMSQWVENVQFETSTSVQDNAANNNVGLKKNLNKCLNVYPKTATQTNECIYDDVLFVGQTRQSTPIRTGSLKQSLLNFSETPIKKAQLTGLNLKKQSSKVFEKKLQVGSVGNHSNFFDDQFDDLIAENSNIIASIEQGTNSKHSNDKRTPSVSNIQRVSVSPQTSSQSPVGGKTSQCIETKHTKNNTSSEDIAILLHDLNKTLQRQVQIVDTSKQVQHDSKTVDSSLRNVIVTTPKERTALLPDDSTPEDISILDSLRQSEQNIVMAVNCTQDNNIGKKNIIQSEIEDIKLIDFSDTFSEEISENHKVPTVSEAPSPPHRSSPDIFEMTQHDAVSKTKPQTPLKQRFKPPAQVSPCLLTKNALTWRQVHLKYGKPLQSEPVPVPNTQNDSVIQVSTKTRSKRKIISSDSETSDDNLIHHQNSIIDLTDSQELVCKSPLKERFLPQKRTNEFIDNEAALSGSASEDEFEQTMGCYMVDSVVVHDEDAENDDVNMTGVYLQSVRSPSAKREAFKIPPRRQYNDYSKIFSQKITEESISYMKDSFIVSDGDSDTEQSMCPLERAEQILKERKRTKRKARSNVLRQPMKKKRILRIHNSSEDDDFV